MVAKPSFDRRLKFCSCGRLICSFFFCLFRATPPLALAAAPVLAAFPPFPELEVAGGFFLTLFTFCCGSCFASSLFGCFDLLTFFFLPSPSVGGGCCFVRFLDGGCPCLCLSFDLLVAAFLTAVLFAVGFPGSFFVVVVVAFAFAFPSPFPASLLFFLSIVSCVCLDGCLQANGLIWKVVQW